MERCNKRHNQDDNPFQTSEKEKTGGDNNGC